ncbi:hypothetical protein [Brockia lithotrophica]|uniref:Spore coat protein YutH n=1 Tax=Brockia lithotrophica TaxID=933949 RepID=A0A660KUG3_9BACL|nr:hypothetical protein [Brockia lithotrophica]RKQ84694.1 hypothetical protein C7438_1183 [Brockia lithotrophica]
MSVPADLLRYLERHGAGRVVAVQSGEGGHRTVGEALARLHLASRGYPLPGRSPRVRFGRLIPGWVEVLREARAFGETLRSSPPESAWPLFEETYAYYHQLAQAALYYLLDHGYESLSQELRRYGVLAHQMFAPRLVAWEDGRVVFLAPDTWRFDVPTRDVAHYVRYVLAEEGPKSALAFLRGYAEVRPFVAEEGPFVYGILLLPYEWVEAYKRYRDRNVREAEARLAARVHRETEWAEAVREFREACSAFGWDVSPIPWFEATRTVG